MKKKPVFLNLDSEVHTLLDTHIFDPLTNCESLKRPKNFQKVQQLYSTDHLCDSNVVHNKRV